MARTVTLLALLCLSSPARAQRPTGHVPDLTSSTLSHLVSSQRGAVSSCAAGEDTDAYLAEVVTSVSPGAAPSTMYNAHIAVRVRSRPRDGELEACVRRRVADALRHQRYAVSGRPLRARHTFRITDRPEPASPRPAPAYSEAEVHRALNAQRSSLQRCVEVAGVPEQITLRVAVEADGRLTLTSADLPPGAPRSALGCLAQAVSRVRVAARPARRVQLVHTMGVRSHARSWWR